MSRMLNMEEMKILSAELLDKRQNMKIRQPVVWAYGYETR